jgi:hypothetical protein
MFGTPKGCKKGWYNVNAQENLAKLVFTRAEWKRNSLGSV